MSHYSVYKTKLGNITVDLLRQAITSLAKEIGAETVTRIFSFYGKSHDVVIGLKSKNLPNGIGFNIAKDGTLTIEGDSYSQHSEFNRIKALVPNYIKAYKVAQNAKMMNPLANVRMAVKQKEVVLEVVV